MTTVETICEPWQGSSLKEVHEGTDVEERYTTRDYGRTEETRYYTTHTGAARQIDGDSQLTGKAPVFLSALQDCKVPRGGQKTLKVTVDGEPSPVVSWFKDGIKIDDSDVERIDNCYKLYIVDMEDADCGVYSVEASNSQGETKCYARLFIEDRDVQSPSVAAPRLIRHFSDIEASRGQNAVFEAVVAGNPKPAVHWLFNNEPIHNSRYHFSNVDNTYSLVVSNVRPEDFGRFALIAENVYGKVSCSASLFVKDEHSGYDATNGFVTDSTRRSESFVDHEGRYSRTHQDSASQYKTSSRIAGKFDETIIEGERRCQRPLGYVVRSSPSDRSERARHRSHSQLGPQRITSADEFLESDYSTEQIHKSREVTTTEKRYRERYIVSDDELGGEYHLRRHRRYKPVEFIVGKRGRYTDKDEHAYKSQLEAQSAARHRVRQRKRRQIRLGSVPIGEHSRRVISDMSATGYRSIDLIVGKPKIQKIVVQKQEESDSRTFSHVATEEQVELTIPKTRHSSTVVKERQRESGYSQIRVEGDHEKRILHAPVEVPSELELKIPKAQHSATVYKETKAADQILTVTGQSVISGQESIRFHDQPLRVDEEVSLTIGKTGGEHSATVVCEKRPDDQFIKVEPGVIKGTHDLRIIEDSIAGYTETDVHIPKPETVPGDHSTTVMRETDIAKQVFNVDRVATIPGERDEKFVERMISAEESVQVKLPKTESRHTSTVVYQQEKEQEMIDFKTVTIPGEHEFKMMEVAPAETEVHLPKAGQHSSTLIREKGEKINLGRIRSLSGEHMYKLVEDSHDDYSSTVMLESKKDRKVYDISLASEVSEVEEEGISGEQHRRGHVVSWLSDVEKRRLAQQEQGRHLTTVVKKQDELESIEMLLPRPVDTSEVVAELCDYSDAQTIVLQQPETIIEKEIIHRDVKSEVVADVATRYAVMSEVAPTVEQASIQIDSVKRAEEHIGLQMANSSSEVVAELKSQLELKSDQIQATESATSVSMDIGEKHHPTVELRFPMPTMEPSRSVVMADVRPALKGPSEALTIHEPSSSEVVLTPAQRGQVELNIRQPDIEASSSTVLADVAARLAAQGTIQKHVTAEPSSACVELDLRRKTHGDVEVNIPGIDVQESSSKVVASLRGKLTTHDEMARALSQPSSSSSVRMTDIGGTSDRKQMVDIRMHNLRVDDSKSEILVGLPGRTETSLIGGATQSSSSISIESSRRPMEITMQAPEQEASSSTLKTRTKYHGLSTAEIRDFGRKSKIDEVEVILHEPRHKHTHSRTEDSQFMQSSMGSSTIIKDIGFSDDSYDRYYISDGEKSSSTMHVDIGGYGYSTTPICVSPVFLKELKDCTVFEGERLILECQVKDADEICWSKDDRVPGDHCNIQFIDRTIARLTISEVFEEDRGLYVCTAFNRDASNQSSAYVTVRASQPVVNGEAYPPATDSSYVPFSPTTVKSDTRLEPKQWKKTVQESSMVASMQESVTTTQSAGQKAAAVQQISAIQQSVIAEGIDGPQHSVDPFAIFGARRGSRGSLGNVKKEEEPFSIKKGLPQVIRKPEGSFMRLEIVTAGNIRSVEWRRDTTVLNSGPDYRLTSKAPAHSLVIPNLRKEHSGQYVVIVTSPSNNTISSTCTVEVTDAPRRFKSSNVAEGAVAEETTSRDVVKEVVSSSKSSSTPSPGRLSERDLEIRTRKDPKPETKITVKEASAENSVFVFSETEEGQFVSVDNNNTKD